ncbi:unnamed protein product [Heligmosomoides polygyrus]|uniref:RRM domain-containing protein n=1 Tax=Heligmosomoides polygyrus TaxID=6339 RepID=A0A183FZ26_HELPZ|nr:unnamed protein product [Heligmosomoides polygyrus]
MMQQNRGLSVYVGNLSYETAEEAIGQMFNQAGQVTNVRIVTDRVTGCPKYFDFCEFTDGAGAHHQNVVNSFNGKDLTVARCALTSPARIDLSLNFVAFFR